MKVFNFSPGPAIIADRAIESIVADFKAKRRGDALLIETSHRGERFLEVKARVEKAIYDLLHLDKTKNKFHVLLTQGGASMEFLRVAANMLSLKKQAYYLDTGFWVQKAFTEAQKLCKTMPMLKSTAKIVFSKQSNGYSRIPSQAELTQLIPKDSYRDTSYCYICTNNTIAGTQYKSFESLGIPTSIPLVADATSDLFATSIPALQLDRFGILFAGTQKNLGTAGLAVVLIRDDILQMLETSQDKQKHALPSLLSYPTLHRAESLYNTPNIFAIYMLEKVLAWISSEGGVETMQQKNRLKSTLLYQLIDSHPLYHGHAEKQARSDVNVVFSVRDESSSSVRQDDLNKSFLALCEKAGMFGLRGHRLLGGVRASMYNAFPYSGAQLLVETMDEFAKSVYQTTTKNERGRF